MQSQDLTIVITSFYSRKKIFKCLDSIESKFKVIIVENTNDKDLKKEIKKNYENVEVILSEYNLGYAKGNNLGLSNVKSKYALIINPDVIIEKESINNFFALAKEKPDFAILAPLIQNEREYSNEYDINPVHLKEVNKVKGFAMFLNIAEFKQIGFFDDNFFMYLEEVDLCKRLMKLKKKIFIDSKIKFFHYGGSSHDNSIDYEVELSRNWHWMWSTFYFNKKYYGYILALLLVSGKFFSSIIKIIFYTLTLNFNKRKIYSFRLSGLFNSIIGKKSWYRPSLD